VKKGFTMLEVLLAMGVVVMAVSVVASIQLRFLLRVFRDQEEIERTFLIKKEIYNYYLKPPKESRKKTTKLEDFGMTIKAQIGQIDNKSSLAQFKDQLRIAFLQGEWKTSNGSGSCAMITFLPKLKSEKEKK
jgi:prepilin-type N-terminal cleavage/methylation domain-containing protein